MTIDTLVRALLIVLALKLAGRPAEYRAGYTDCLRDLGLLPKHSGLSIQD